MDNETLEPELVEHPFVRTQETANHETNREEQNWEAIRDECVSGGAMNSSCNIIAASLGNGKLEVVAKRLSCGCILVLVGNDEVTGL